MGEKRKRPVIGIFPLMDEEDRSCVIPGYVRAIERVGGVPILLPYTEDTEVIDHFAQLCQGFLFTGGVDVEPARYGEETEPFCGTISFSRDRIEFLAFERVYPMSKPILGICRGAQLINVALGGSLYQDIPAQIRTDLVHRQTMDGTIHSHTVRVYENTPLYDLAGAPEIPVNSFHHQSVKQVGQGLQVMAEASDGVVEAVYGTDHPFLWAIQWHPERTFDTDRYSKDLFERFMEACKIC